MKISPVTFCFGALLVCGGCAVDPAEVPGTYTVQGRQHTLDTLRVLPNGTYARTLRSQADGRVLFRNHSTWAYVNGDLILRDYLPDSDEDFGPEAVYGLGAMTCFFPVTKRLYKPVIYTQADGDFYYEKL
ncbi:MAG: hypothetical protein JWQ74_3507 [Marmoricola sp.]|nr:hypothetical protein [Marmoricola sp.]